MGFGVLCSAVSRRAIECVSSSRTRTNRFASGDQAKSDVPPLSIVSRCASPPRRSSSQTWPPLPSCLPDEKARYRSSGLHLGVLSDSGEDVRRIVVSPSQLVIHTSVSDLSFAESADDTLYAI